LESTISDAEKKSEEETKKRDAVIKKEVDTIAKK